MTNRDLGHVPLHPPKSPVDYAMVSPFARPGAMVMTRHGGVEYATLCYATLCSMVAKPWCGDAAVCCTQQRSARLARRTHLRGESSPLAVHWQSTGVRLPLPLHYQWRIRVHDHDHCHWRIDCHPPAMRRQASRGSGRSTRRDLSGHGPMTRGDCAVSQAARLAARASASGTSASAEASRPSPHSSSAVRSLFKCSLR